MGRRDDLIALYAAELRERCGVEPDMDLLEKVTIGCGPAIYDPATTCVATNDPDELDVIRRNFLIRKLALWDGPGLSDAIAQAIDEYPTAEQRKHRAVLYYLLVKMLGKEEAYL